MAYEIPVLYGTETGNAEYCAEMLVEAMEQNGFAASLVNMEDYSHDDITDERLIFIITSTYGNGDPPDNAADFLEFLQTETLDLPNLRFAVCALGDSSFARFAQCGKDFEAALLKNKAIQIFDRIDCDGDFELDFDYFKDQALAFVRDSQPLLGDDAAGTAAEPAKDKTEASSDASYGRDNPFHATLVKKQLLSKAGSNKETMHYELQIQDSALDYRVGDCFGVYAKNPASAIQYLLQVMQKDGSDTLSHQGEAQTLYSILESKCLQYISLALFREIKNYATNANAMVNRYEFGDEALSSYLKDHHVADVLADSGAQSMPIETLIGHLRKLQARLYSVASSPVKNADKVAFVIETLRYQRNGRTIQGVASCWLADSVDEGAKVPLYLVKNDAFQFPKDNRPVIMIGPGTGIAPFRAYLEEVEADNRQNKTWLFFGHQHAATDFLYAEEIRAWQQKGILNRLDLAWSRDQEHKIYVQNRLQEQGAEVWNWITQDALVYVCGDAIGMAPGVAEALKDIAATHGSVSDREQWFQGMIDQGRFLADVY